MMEAKDYAIYKSENIYEERSYMAGKEAGIREVVEFVEGHTIHTTIPNIFEVYEGGRNAWQAQLKKWGIKPREGKNGD